MPGLILRADWREHEGALRAFNPQQPDDLAGWAPLPPIEGQTKSSQELLLECPIQEVLMEGPRGSAKTEALLGDYAVGVETGLGEDHAGVVFRRSYKGFDKFITKAKRLFYNCFPGRVSFKESKGDYRFVWNTGEQLALRVLNNMQTFEDDFQGTEVTWIGWEELTKWPTLDLYHAMNTCLRTGNPNVLLRTRSTTNPDGPGHDEVKRYYQLPVRPGAQVKTIRDRDGERAVIHTNLLENVALLHVDPEYGERVRKAAAAVGEHRVQAWVHGSWDYQGGGMFSGCWGDHNVVEPFQIPHTWRKDRAFDWGSAHPFAVVWFAESDGSDYQDAKGTWRSSVRGDLFIIGEWYGWTGRTNEGLGLSDAKIAQGIRQREVNWGWRVDPGPADGSIFKKENRPTSTADIMAQPVRLDDGQSYPGIRWTVADRSPGSRKPGWQLVRAYLEQAKQPEAGMRERPGLFVFANCTQARRLIPATQRKESDLEDVDKNSEDHYQDTVRYRVKAGATVVSDGTVIGNY